MGQNQNGSNQKLLELKNLCGSSQNLARVSSYKFCNEINGLSNLNKVVKVFPLTDEFKYFRENRFV